MKKGVFFAFVVLAVFLVTSCLSTQKLQTSPSATDKREKEAGQAEKKSVKPSPKKTEKSFSDNSFCSVPLESNPSSGFSWECIIANPLVAELSECVYKQNQAEKNTLGTGGVEVFIFTCKEPGSTTLTFTYRRPWEGGEKAEIRRAQLIVDDHLKGKVNFF